jgi:pimeloyl-ACP methyl ester carboxylesterase
LPPCDPHHGHPEKTVIFTPFAPHLAARRAGGWPALLFVLLVALPVPVVRASDVMQAGVSISPDGTRIHYVDNRRAGDAPVLVFVPGWAMDSSVWKAQIAAFGSAHRVVSLDPRSQGASDKPTTGNTPEVRAGDLEALLAKLDLRNVVLVAWSQGVQDVAAYVDRFGTQRVAGLVLIDSPVAAGAAGLKSDPAAAQAFFDLLGIYAAHPREYLQGMMRAIFTRPLAPAELQHRVEVAMQTPTTSGIAMLVMDMQVVDRREALKKIDKPTLVVAAASSPDLAAQRAGAEQVRGATLEVIADAGHAVFADQPEAFNAALRKFLGGLRE